MDLQRARPQDPEKAFIGRDLLRAFGGRVWFVCPSGKDNRLQGRRKDLQACMKDARKMHFGFIAEVLFVC